MMTPIQSIQLSEDEFDQKFTLVKNHFDPNASNDGYAFETYGQELAFIRNKCPQYIWTVVEEDGKLWIVSGYKFVNRIYYLITNEPVPNHVEYIICWE
ncbi:MAG: hypothetical protein H3C64_03395 [Candidatus Kuenenia stuttgartiensis]|nr:hypothetical protein [Candidatus Kuenenia stuttgartiensis]